MQQDAAIYIGSSHILSVIAAGKAARKPLDTINLKHIGPFVDEEDKGVLHPVIVERLAGKTVISLVGGNMHNEIALIRHPRPFDFVLPEEPDLPADDGELIPTDALRAALQKRMFRALAVMELLRKNAEGDVYHLESPPPIADDDYIRGNIDKYFEKRGVGKFGVVSPRLRYKLWRLHSGIVRQCCRELGIKFVPCPAAAVEEGFLRTDLYANATHANEVYGAMVLAQIEAL